MRSVFELALLAAIVSQGVLANEDEVENVDDTVIDEQNPDEVEEEEVEETLDAKYQRFDDAMTAIGYTAEIFEVETDDGWVLPLYHVTSGVDGEVSNSEGTVLMLHGSFMSGASFAELGETLAMQLYNEGFDVWFGSMRGAHDTECAVDPDGFFVEDRYFVDCGYDALFSFYEMGTEDLPSLVDGVLQQTGEESVSLVGFSRGTTQALIGLAENGADFQGKVDRAILLAPCVWGTQIFTQDQQIKWTNWRTAAGINNSRPDQFADHTTLVCDAAAAEADEDLKTALDFNCSTLQTISDPSFVYPLETIEWGSSDYWYQIGFADELQEPISQSDYASGTYSSDAISLGDITIPVSMYVGIDDANCPAAQAQRIHDQLGSSDKTLTVIEYKDSEDKENSGRMDHDSWGMPLSDSILDRVVNSLQDSASYMSVITAVSAASVAAIALF